MIFVASGELFVTFHTRTMHLLHGVGASAGAFIVAIHTE